MYGICNLSLVPCRKDPSHASEMVTQLLFGEHFSILDTQTEGWIRIKTSYDKYECWISEKQFAPISFKTFEHLETGPLVYSNEMLEHVTIESSQESFPVFAGSVLPGFYGGKFAIEKVNYSFTGKTILSYEKKDRNNITKTAMNFLNAPYLWGGKTEFGIDCSGFTQIVFKLNGIKLPRDAYQQAESGEALNFVEEAQTGDLAFFDNAEGKITHVGIVLTPDTIIHASGKVRIDKFDHQGIFHSEKKRYSHNLRVVKSLFAAS